MKDLNEPLLPGELETRILRTRKKGRQGLVTLAPTRAAVENRLNQVYPSKWKTEFAALSRDPFVFICSLQIYPEGGVTWLSRDGLGSAAALQAAWDRAFVDAAASYGIGRYLDGMTAWINLKDNGEPTVGPKGVLRMLDPGGDGPAEGDDETITAEQYETLAQEATDAGWQTSVFKAMVRQVTGKEKGREITVSDMRGIRGRIQADSERESWHKKYAGD